MKKGKAAKQKPDAAKRFRKYSRRQILGAVTVMAGLILLVLLQRSEAPPTNESPVAAPTIIKARKVDDRSAREEQTVIKGTNRPPVITSIILSPNVVFPGTPICVEVKTTDPDQDDVLVNCVWKVNGQIVAEQSGTELTTTGLHKGDLITVTVTPDDSKEQGQPLDSNGILVQNRPPEITSMPGAGVSSGHFSYQVLAEDPDNDPLHFSLEQAPAGMTISATGLIEWNVPRGLQGKQEVRFIVSDGSASSFQTFNLNLSSDGS